MEYHDLVQSAKKIFITRLEKIISDEAYKANPLLSKSAYINVVYTEIMSLGYNFGNIQKAADDIYEMEFLIQRERKEIITGVTETLRVYPKEVQIFSEFHKSYQKGTDFTVLLNELIEKLK